eukprot:SAG31_NODE_4483_length_3196_cov_36.451082_2_plen_97_part_00
MEVSAYRFHEEDPLAFTDGESAVHYSLWFVRTVFALSVAAYSCAAGVRLVWRISDILNYNLLSPKCFIETVNTSAGDQDLGGGPTTVSSYVWVYTW